MLKTTREQVSNSIEKARIEVLANNIKLHHPKLLLAKAMPHHVEDAFNRLSHNKTWEDLDVRYQNRLIEGIKKR